MKNEAANNIAAKALAWIESKLEEGKTVSIANPMRVTVVSPKTVADFEKAGRPLFKLTDDGLYISEGKRYAKFATPKLMLAQLSAA